MEFQPDQREIDQEGRVKIPRHFLQQAGLKPGDLLTFHILGDRIYFDPVRPFCTFCHCGGNLHYFHRRYICERCCKDAGLLPEKAPDLVI